MLHKLGILVLNLIMVFKEVFHGGVHFRGRVQINKTSFKTLLRIRPPILVQRNLVTRKRFASDEQAKEKSRKGESGTGVIQVIERNCVEMRHAFSANVSRVDILVRVNGCVDTRLSQSVHQNLNLIQVGIIVNAWSNFDSLPNDTKSNVVNSPSHQIGDVFLLIE